MPAKAIVPPRDFLQRVQKEQIDYALVLHRRSLEKQMQEFLRDIPEIQRGFSEEVKRAALALMVQTSGKPNSAPRLRRGDLFASIEIHWLAATDFRVEAKDTSRYLHNRRGRGRRRWLQRAIGIALRTEYGRRLLEKRRVILGLRAFKQAPQITRRGISPILAIGLALFVVKLITESEKQFEQPGGRYR